MTDPRAALEGAWLEIHHEGYPPENERDTCCKCDRFRRFLDAEAWTDAALMLVPEGKGFCIMGNAAKVGKHVGVGDTPALALAAACIKAKKTGDGQ